jgi:glycosyltransferase involved in cell wall biosynthesis
LIALTNIMNKQKKILLIYPDFYSFVRQDYNILSDKYIVEKYHYIHSKKLIIFTYQLLRQFLHLLFFGWKYDVFFIWFSDYHSLLPIIYSRLFRKKTMLIIGGFDAVSIPEIEFGLFYKKNLRTKFGILSYKMADFILPVDESLIKSTNYYVNPNGQKIGFLNFINTINGVIKTIPTGQDPNLWNRIKMPENRDVLTIGGCYDLKIFKRKGHDFFIEVARLLPQFTFTIVGIHDDLFNQIKNTLPANIKVYGFVNANKLVEFYSSHKVFTQFSLSEGLPTTLCEAMICGCIPVGSNVNGIPNAIGDCGYILDEINSLKASDLIIKAMNSPLSQKARERIIEFFHIEKRQKSLFDIID